MRQTLLRIRLDQLWTLEPVDGIAAIGVGYLLIPWLLYGLWWWWRVHPRAGEWNGHLSSISGWAALGLAILALPTFAPIDSVPVFGYGFMLFAGFLVGGWTAGRRAERAGLSRDLIWDLAMWVFFAGIVGARLFYVVQYHDRVFAGRNGLAQHLFALVNLPDGGLVLYGGVLLAIAAYVLFCRVRNVNGLALADVVVPSIFVGLAFGRFGCFLNGCCYGDVCHLPWAVTFPRGSVPFIALVNRGFLTSDAAASLPLHPTQLYSSINALVLAFLTATYFRYRPKHGAVVALGLMTYPVTRIVIEILRGDEMGQFGTGLTISQWVSLGVFVGGLVFSLWLSRQPQTTDGPSLPGSQGAA